MNKQHLVVLSGVLAAILASGCATTNQAPAPTHQWVAYEDVSGAAYRVDNIYCSKTVLGTDQAQVIRTGTEEYTRYVACMQERGYKLAVIDR